MDQHLDQFIKELQDNGVAPAEGLSEFLRLEGRLTHLSKGKVDRYIAAPFYTVARDKVMSRWATRLQKQEGAFINIMPCPTLGIAEMVAAACKAEPDLDYIRVQQSCPRIKGPNYHLFNALSGSRFFGLSRSNYRDRAALLHKHGVPVG